MGPLAFLPAAGMDDDIEEPDCVSDYVVVVHPNH